MYQQPFGSPSAEDEVPLFSTRYFRHLSDQRHELARHANCRFIVGRRGTGKTALAHYLRAQSQEPYDASIIINNSGTTFMRVTKEVADADRRVGMPFHDDIAQLWLLIFWTAVMTELDQRRLLTSKAAKDYLAIAHGDFIKGTQVLIDGLAAVMSSQGQSLLDFDRRQELLNQVSYPRALEDTWNCLERLKRVAVIVDVPEDCLQPPALAQAIRGLLIAANTPRNDTRLHRSIHVKCLVPSEAWTHLTSQMAGKDRYQPLEVRWSPNDLMCLVAYRYNAFLIENDKGHAVRPSNEGFDWTSPANVRAWIWDSIFPRKAEGRARVLEPALDVIVRHTQLRPRQMISLCNAIAEKSNVRKFNPNHVTGGLVDRVNWFAEEIFASYAAIHPDAEKLLRQYLQNRPAVFEATTTTGDHEFWTIAYQLGAVGSVTKGVAQKYSEAEFEYYQAAEFEFCGGPARWVPHDERVAVHPIFHKHFNITETRDTLVGFRGWWEAAALF
jgi:hypothetical protein